MKKKKTKQNKGNNSFLNEEMLRKADELERLEKKANEIHDNKLEEIIKLKLQYNPNHYLNFLQKIIDEVNESIPDDVLFEELKPSLSVYKGADKIDNAMNLEDISTAEITWEDFTLLPSPESVNLFFRPGVRKKLYEWQRTFFDESLGNSNSPQRFNAKKNIEKVFNALLFEGQGRPKAISEKAERQILLEKDSVQMNCKEIFSKNKRNRNSRNISIKEKFQDVGKQIVDEINNGSLFIKSPEKLRNVVFAKRYNCTERAIEEFIRDKYYALRVLKKASKKNPKITRVTIDCVGKNEKITYHEE